MTPARSLPEPLAPIAVKSAEDTGFHFALGRGAAGPELAAAGPIVAEDGRRLGTVVLDYDGAVYAERVRSAVVDVALLSVPGLLLLVPLGWYAGKRLALPHSRVLLHQPYGQVGYSQVTDLEIAAREILRMRELLEQILAVHTGQSIARIHEDTDRDFVMEADAAKEYGVIDEIITTRGAVDRTGPIR